MSTQFEKTRQYWGSAIKRGNLIYPNDQVIRFIKRYFKDKKDIKILDFGCGGGRNSVALLREGYNVTAMDYTTEAIEMTRDKCRQIGMEDATIILNTGFDIPISANSVDAIIADGSLFYYTKDDITKVVTNLCKIMKQDALMWADFRTKNDSLFAKGDFIAEGLYRLGNGTDREDCAYYFADEDDIKEIFNGGGLSIVSIDDFTYSENNHKIVNSWYHVIAKKEA